MRREAETNAEADRRRKDLIEARNHADNTVYTAEKMLRDFHDKIPADQKTKVEEGVKQLKDAMSRDDVDAIKRETEALGQVIQTLGGSFYQQPGAAGPEQTPPTGAPGGTNEGGPEDVVDGEFKTN